MYVDHLLLTGNDLLEINRVLRMLDDQFTIKDLSDVKYFLGMEVARPKKVLHYSSANMH